MPNLAKETLIEADGSTLPCAVSWFLHAQRVRSNTELDTRILVAHSFGLFFGIFDEYTKYRFELTLAFNSTKKKLHGYSETTEARSRPHTLLTASRCTFLVGEDKLHGLHAAEADLRLKVEPLNPMYYGEVKFIVGYIVAGSQFQWVYIGRDGSKDIHRMNPPLNLSKLVDCCSFLLNLGNVFQLLQKMANSVPDVPGRRAMFSVEESSSGKRISYFYANKVVKHIRDFYSHSTDQGTSLSKIGRAYDAGRGCQFLLQSEIGPTVSAHRAYKVECTLLGYSCSLESKQDCRWMAQCVCHVLCILHKAGLLHRDIRFPNIVRLSETEFMLIDFESVAESLFRLPEGFRCFRGWCSKTLEGNVYTPYSDMYSLGKLQEETLPNSRTSLAEEFVRKLTNKQLSASDALHDPWLSGPIASLVS
ncbi:hypothetical protein KC19_8G002200 [Ceratodon purpureus]|uniref:Protein kinase domain-containing protein n=1 Tax=Ceratodon purpureus TaxID=3225 RepID=A0A8T0GY66_CERPU|nr:hypothetical protein KC19_8G001800 [Ceratodon purpureus]KAG0563064.1 hypothetical protein KC19_8G002200 [Ceratodon purpureus]